MLEEQGKHDKAMDYYKKALAITVKALGEDHACWGYLLQHGKVTNLGQSQENWAQAFEFYTRAANAYKSTYGAEHDKTVCAVQKAEQARSKMA